MGLDFADKVFIVTGGASGIGAATLSLASKRGAHAVVADINIEHAEELAEKLSTSGPEALALKMDLADEQQIKAGIAKTVDHFGRIDVLNNNAAALSQAIAERDSDIEQMPTDVWDKSYQVEYTWCDDRVARVPAISSTHTW